MNNCKNSYESIERKINELEKEKNEFHAIRQLS